MKDYTNEILNELESAANEAIEKLQAAKERARANALIAVANALQDTEEDICFAFSEGNFNMISYLTGSEVYRLTKKVTEDLPLAELNKIAHSKNPIWKVRELLSIEDTELIRSCSDCKHKNE